MTQNISVLIGLGAVHGLVLSLVCVRAGSRKARPELAALGGFLACFSLLVLNDALLQTGVTARFPWLFGLGDFLVFWVGPWCLRYVRMMCGAPAWSRRAWWLQLAPGWIVLGVILLQLQDFGPARDAAIAASAAGEGAISGWQVAAIVSCTTYLMVSGLVLARYRRALEDRYSDISRYRLRWLGAILGTCVALWGLWVVAMLMGVPTLDVAAQAGFAFGAYVLGYAGLTHPPPWLERHGERPIPPPTDPGALGHDDTAASTPLADVPDDPDRVGRDSAPLDPPLSPPAGAASDAARPKYARAALDADARRRVSERLDAVMARDLVYLEPEVTLADLARRVGVSPHALSQVLNEHRGQNFYNYINGLRVQEVLRCFSDPAYDGQSILEVAYASGFASKAAFNACFKQMTGSTPSAVRESLRVRAS